MGISVAVIPNRWLNRRTWFLVLGVMAVALATGKLELTERGPTLLGLCLPSCPLRHFTGLRCPFCGMTTGMAWLARGDLMEALRSNILSPVFALGVLSIGAYALGCRLLAGRRVRVDLCPEVRRSIWVLGAITVVLSWIGNLFLARS